MKPLDQQLPEERQFWERLHGMPFVEAEQECVLRRERLVLESNMLKAEQLRAKKRRKLEEAEEIGVALFEVCTAVSCLNERIKYYRKALDRISWRNAVAEVCGRDAFDACAKWIAAHEVAYPEEPKELMP